MWDFFLACLKPLFSCGREMRTKPFLNGLCLSVFFFFFCPPFLNFLPLHLQAHSNPREVLLHLSWGSCCSQWTAAIGFRVRRRCWRISDVVSSQKILQNLRCGISYIPPLQHYVSANCVVMSLPEVAFQGWTKLCTQVKSWNLCTLLKSAYENCQKLNQRHFCLRLDSFWFRGS